MPAPIYLVARRLSLTSEAAPLGGKILGMLVVQGDQGSTGTTRPMIEFERALLFRAKSPIICYICERRAGASDP